jgi:hypothetical protein
MCYLHVKRTLIIWLDFADVLYTGLKLGLRLLELSKRVGKVTQFLDEIKSDFLRFDNVFGVPLRAASVLQLAEIYRGPLH